MNQVNVIVKVAFRDRYSGKHYKQGDKLTISDARYREIKRCGDYVQVVQPAAAPPAKENK